MLHLSFLRQNFSVVALYMETCDGVPDHAAEFRRQVAKHRLAYPALDVEAGPINDPTRKRFPWAPHALIVDKKGKVLRTYGHMPRLEIIKQDVESLIATGLFPDRATNGWQEFTAKAWVELRTGSRVEKHVLKSIGRDGATIRVGKENRRIFREHLDRTDRNFQRTELKSEPFTLEDRSVTARVFRATWKRGDATFVEHQWIASGVRVRRKEEETAADGSKTTRTERLQKWADPVMVGAKKIPCRLLKRTSVTGLNRTTELIWTSTAVPGHLVKRTRTSTAGGETSAESTIAVAFGLR